MRYDQDETNGKVNAEPRNAEAELFAEILNRLDEKKDGSKDAQPGNQPQSAKTIDLVELFYYMLSKLHYILLGMLIGALLLGVYESRRVTPIYTATSKLYIMGTTGSSIIADLQIGTVLTMDYQEVFKTWEVHQMVNDELGTNYSYSMLQSMVSVANPEDTRILYITARHPDAQMAADIANAYATAAKKFITQTMNTDEPSTFSIALVPGVASSTSITGYVIRGILLGTVLVGGALVLWFLLDNRPKSPDDLMRVAGVPTLAVIPRNSQFPGSRLHGRRSDRK